MVKGENMKEEPSLYYHKGYWSHEEAAFIDEIEHYVTRVAAIPTRYSARVTERIQRDDPLALSAALNMAAGTEGLGE